MTINVAAVNDWPQSADDSYSTPANTTLNVAAPGVLGNDSDIDNPVLTAVPLYSPQHGAFTFNANGSFSYTPFAGYVGPDGFAYLAIDGDGAQDWARVKITVTQAP